MKSSRSRGARAKAEDQEALQRLPLAAQRLSGLAGLRRARVLLYQAVARRRDAEAAFCAGGLIFLANYCKLPRDPELAAAVKAVERDEKVFAYPAEFVAYHGGEVQMKNLRTREEGVLTKTRDVRSKFVLRVGDTFREAERIEELVHEGWTVIDYMLT
jgi:hypothetical protein